MNAIDQLLEHVEDAKAAIRPRDEFDVAAREVCDPRLYASPRDRHAAIKRVAFELWLGSWRRRAGY
jgi:hypothetical protein